MQALLEEEHPESSEIFGYRTCPVCGGRIHGHGWRSRFVQDCQGSSFKVWIHRKCCRHCHLTFTFLPQILHVLKIYTMQVILNVLRHKVVNGIFSSRFNVPVRIQRLWYLQFRRRMRLSLLILRGSAMTSYYSRSDFRLIAAKTRERSEDVSLYAQKRYDNQLLKKARAEKLQIEKCLKVLEPDADIEKVYDSMPEALKPYITANEKTDFGYAQRWQNKKVSKARRLEDDEGFKTMRGDVVRSKSEVIIADRLFKAGIPYRYEVLFHMKFENLKNVYPDFQILKTSTKEEFFWEHLGMMDDPKYFNSQLKKISGYARSGYILGKSLILTFESKERPLDIFCVDKLINTFLL